MIEIKIPGQDERAAIRRQRGLEPCLESREVEGVQTGAAPGEHPRVGVLRGPEGPGDRGGIELVGGIAPLESLGVDDLQLPLDLLRLDPGGRGKEPVGEEEEREFEGGGWEGEVQGGGVEVGPGVQIAPDLCDALGERAGRAVERVLDEQVLGEVRHALLTRGLVVDSSAHEQVGHDAGRAGVRVKDHAKTVGKKEIPSIPGKLRIPGMRSFTGVSASGQEGRRQDEQRQECASGEPLKAQA